MAHVARYMNYYVEQYRDYCLWVLNDHQPSILDVPRLDLTLERWMSSRLGKYWREETEQGKAWLNSSSAYWWMRTRKGAEWLDSQQGIDWLDEEAKRRKAGETTFLQSGMFLNWATNYTCNPRNSGSESNGESSSIPSEGHDSSGNVQAKRKWFETSEGKACADEWFLNGKLRFDHSGVWQEPAPLSPEYKDLFRLRPPVSWSLIRYNPKLLEKESAKHSAPNGDEPQGSSIKLPSRSASEEAEGEA
ncbi:hypothetical protein F4780DRAFT_417406 [Xylariomycetidae sp. FL0641]|nr:hypothetical protein F4780DRAFT_417406 [Xylariomycetidae sp. FL0641]